MLTLRRQKPHPGRTEFLLYKTLQTHTYNSLENPAQILVEPQKISYPQGKIRSQLFSLKKLTMSGSSKREAVKVVFIDTQYVQTDQTSFKSVVQQLTGKDSCVTRIKGSSSEGAKRKILSSADRNNNASGSMLSKGMSFKDLDRFVLELPVEEFAWLYDRCWDNSS